MEGWDTGIYKAYDLIAARLDGVSVTHKAASFGQAQIGHVLYFKQEKKTDIIYFLVHFNSTFASLAAPSGLTSVLLTLYTTRNHVLSSLP